MAQKGYKNLASFPDYIWTFIFKAFLWMSSSHSLFFFCSELLPLGPFEYQQIEGRECLIFCHVPLASMIMPNAWEVFSEYSWTHWWTPHIKYSGRVRGKRLPARVGGDVGACQYSLPQIVGAAHLVCWPSWGHYTRWDHLHIMPHTSLYHPPQQALNAQESCRHLLKTPLSLAFDPDLLVSCSKLLHVTTSSFPQL
jgi:hypothetical protein